jgi:Tfp pilus assembly protein PilO
MLDDIGGWKVLEMTVATILVVAMVLGLSLKTLSKGYGYKHTIDPLPNSEEEEDRSESQVKEGNR